MEEKLYLQHVKLSGYKSIKETEIEFRKGLNIIIGKNAAGKTNFLFFLDKLIQLEFSQFNDFTSKLTFQNGNKISIESTKSFGLEELLKNPNLLSQTSSSLKIDDELVEDNVSLASSINEKLILKRIYFNSSFLRHGIPKHYPIVQDPTNLTFGGRKLYSELSKLFIDSSSPFFIRILILELMGKIGEMIAINEEEIKNSLTETFSKYTKLKSALNEFTPITDFRLSENFIIHIDFTNNSFSISNLFFEFKIDNQWLPFSSLSDGTKRLFYLISEIFDTYDENDIQPTSTGFFIPKNEVSRIVLLEEPELGIHPHQFQKLLTFLREQSRDKQIIFTTHSPQALDILDNKELDRIILAEYEGQQGTILRKLSAHELQKAIEYKKENYLSDYWLYSDLEK